MFDKQPDLDPKFTNTKNAVDSWLQVGGVLHHFKQLKTNQLIVIKIKKKRLK